MPLYMKKSEDIYIYISAMAEMKLDTEQTMKLE